MLKAGQKGKLGKEKGSECKGPKAGKDVSLGNGKEANMAASFTGRVLQNGAGALFKARCVRT